MAGNPRHHMTEPRVFCAPPDWTPQCQVRLPPAVSEAQRQAFSKCTTARERAECNSDLFLEHYFLTNGQLDANKTKEPLVLKDCRKCVNLSSKIEKWPGLHVRSGSTHLGAWFCIGWDAGAVAALANQTREEASREERERGIFKRWSDAYKEHQNHMRNRKTAQRHLGPDPVFDAGRTIGSYVAQVADHWEQDYVPTLEIHCQGDDGSLDCSFDFGFIKGTMELGLCNNSSSDAGGSVESTPENEREGMRDHDEDYDTDPEEYKCSRKHPRSDPEADAGAAKKVKLAPHLHRMTLYMEGTCTAENVCFETWTGRLGFRADGTTFEGWFYIGDEFSATFDIKGYKVSDTPRQPEGERF